MRLFPRKLDSFLLPKGMEKNACCTCFKPKATLTCGICTESVCKYCAQFLDEDAFAFWYRKEPELSHTTYCPPCFDAKVAPSQERYNAIVEKAKDVHIYFKKQNKETRFIRRDEDRVSVKNCIDQRDVLMRLAFAAASRDLNGVIDVEVESRKVRTTEYQTMEWWGSGIPAHINPDKLMKDRSFWSTPN